MNRTPVISMDRLTDISTDELTRLAEYFHVLTVRLYEELCTRRTAERGTTEIERVLNDHDGDSS